MGHDDRRLTQIDQSAILHEAQEIGPDFVRRSETAFTLGRELRPLIERAYSRAVIQDVGAHRHYAWSPRGGA